LICPYCQTKNREQAIYCKECGRLLGVTCPNCRSTLPEAAKFCDICGHDLSQPVVRPAAAQAQFASQAGFDTPARAQAPAQQQQSNLQQYVPRELLAKLADAQRSGGMVGERRIVTMLFCDVKDSTSAAEQMDPEDWSEVINGAFEYMIAPVYRYEGIVARLMGDGILAFFGAPIAHEDDAARALLAGLDIVNESQGYQRLIEQRHGVKVAFRVGVNTGRVVVGAVGSDLRLEYTALGDAINVAARMEQTAEPGTVRIAEDTHRLVAPLFDFEELGGVSVKGKREPVVAYRVLRRAASTGRLRGIAGLESPLVGRDDEVASLKFALQELSQERGGRIIFLTGQAGLGKTRLIRELHQQWQDDGTTPAGLQFWIHQPVASYQASEAYRVLKGQLRLMYGIPESATAQETADALKQHIGELPLPEQAGVFEPLAKILGALEEDKTDQPVDGETFKRQLIEAAVVTLRHQVGHKPAVLVLDDLHWADPASIEIIQHLFQLVHSEPVLFLCVSRPDRGAASWPLREHAAEGYADRYQELVLRPLSDEDSQRMLDGLLPGMSWPARMRALILEKAEGNPLFIEEVVRALIDGGVLARDGDGRWYVKGRLDEFVIPGNLQALLAARIDRLYDDGRRVLQSASVIGRSFGRQVLERINDQSIDLDRALHTLVSAELIEADGQGADYRFRNTLIQEIVYRSILRRTRRDYHRKVGEALLLMVVEQRDEQLPALAHHFYQAQDKRAVPFNRRAGDQAYELYANKEAAVFYNQAIEIAELAKDIDVEQLTHLYLRRGRAIELSSSFAEALDNYRKMEDTARERGDRAMELAALVAMGTVYSTANDQYNAEKAESLAERALALTGEMGDEATEAKIRWNLLNAYRLNRQPPLALAAGERSLELARKNNLREQLAYTANDMTHVYMSAGLPDKASSTVQEAIGLWRELGNRPMLADSLSTATMLGTYRGEFEKSVALSEEAHQISLETKNAWGQSYSRMAIGDLYWLRGDPDKTVESMTECIRLAYVAGFVAAPLFIGARLAMVYAHMGQYDKAIARARRSLADSRTSIDFYVPIALAALGQVLLLAGQSEEARTVFEELMGMNFYLEPLFEAIIEENKCRFLLVEGRYKEVIRSARNEVGVLDEVRGDAMKPSALHLYGLALLKDGQIDKASEILDQAISEARRLELQWPMWQILAGQAELAEARGDSEGATRYSQESRQVFEAIAGRIADPELRDSFRAANGF
jgi:class 3 adenylate cyclase/tetratricopeptide (TPR) repeat protein